MFKLREAVVRKVFDVLVVLKGIDGLLESLGGALLFAVSGAWLMRFAAWITASELTEDPKDLIANGIVHLANSLSADAKTFVAVYLLAHGIVKIFLVVNLLRNRLWAYPAAMVFLGLFLAYQIDRLTFGFSIFFLLLSAFDAILLVLVWHEYQWRKTHSVIAR